MCGLLAGSGTLDVKTLAKLGKQNAERGTDSAGIAWLEKGEPTIAKIAQHPQEAYGETLWDLLGQASKSGVVIGHTRMATMGAVCHANAHPFLKDGIAFAHNGVIQNHASFGKYAVDSESLIHGIKKRDFSRYIGSIALVWIEKGRLHAYRSGNPLYGGYKGRGLYLASSPKYLETVGCADMGELAEGFIYTFSRITYTKKIVPRNRRHQWQNRIS